MNKITQKSVEKVNQYEKNYVLEIAGQKYSARGNCPCKEGDVVSFDWDLNGQYQNIQGPVTIVVAPETTTVNNVTKTGTNELEIAQKCVVSAFISGAKDRASLKQVAKEMFEISKEIAEGR